MAKQVQIELYPLDEVRSKVYKTQKLTEPVLVKPKDLLNDLKNLKMAAKFCDSTYHLVNSDLSNTLKEKKNLLTRGLISDVISVIAPDETVHGQRFIIYKKNKKIFLVGDTLTALKKLSN